MRELQRDVRLQLLGGDAGDDLAIGRDDRLGLGRLEHAFAEQRRVRREALLVQRGAGRRCTRRASRRRRNARRRSGMPCRRTSPWTRRLSAAARMPLRSVALAAPLSCARAATRALRADPVLQQRQVPVHVVDPRLGAGDARGEPFAVRKRDETVVARRARSASAARCRRRRSPTAAANARSSSIQPSALGASAVAHVRVRSRYGEARR